MLGESTPQADESPPPNDIDSNVDDQANNPTSSLEKTIEYGMSLFSEGANKVDNGNNDTEQNETPSNPVLVFGSQKNDYSEDNNNENEGEDQFDDEIELCAHQPTFVNLNGLIPCGYSSLLELSKASIEKSTSQPVETNYNNQGLAVMPSESLSIMNQRNKDKWSEIGYDPNHGKGNLKCSYTLSQFRPSSIMGTANKPVENLNENKPVASDNNSSPQNVIRMNSSEGKRKKYTLSNSDEEEEKKETFGDINMLINQEMPKENGDDDEEEEECKESNLPQNPVLIFGSNKSVYSEEEDNYENFESYDNEWFDDGIELCAHQPTFVNLDSLVPRGYSSLLELPKARIEKSSSGSVDSPALNQNMVVMPSESLSQMGLRNKDKWSEIGYDPNHGKGNMKCSFTLAQFRPSALIRKSPVAEKRQEKKELLVLGEPEEEEAKVSIKKVKRRKRTNSSESIRKKYAMSESDDAEEEEEGENEGENKKEEGHKVFGSISMLIQQPFIQNNDDDAVEEEEEEAEDPPNQSETENPFSQSETENPFSQSEPEDQTSQAEAKEQINQSEAKEQASQTELEDPFSQSETDDQPAESSFKKPDDESQKESKEKVKDKKSAEQKKAAKKEEEAPKDASKPTKSLPSYNERYNMFLTQIQEQKIRKASKSDDEEIFAKKKDAQGEKSKELHRTYKAENPFFRKEKALQQKGKRSSSSIVANAPKIYQPFPTYQPKPPLDLSPFNDEDFDAEKMKKKIPKRLLDIVTHPPESVVFRALCGEDISGYPTKVVNQIISDLKKYLKKCVKMNMIGESSYVDCIINNIKVDVKSLNKEGKKKDEKIDQKIDQAECFFEDRKQQWKEKKNILEVERELALEDLDLKNQEEISSLDEKWNSEKMQSKYNKPSPKLIELRQHARALIAAHKFEDAQCLADQIAEQEAIETKEAGIRMQREYRQAHEHLSQKFDTDRKAMYDSYESKLNKIIASESSDLHPFEKRLDNLQKMKKNMELAKKINAKSAANDNSALKKIPLVAKTPPLSLNAKLKLPPLKSLKKSDSKSCTQNK